MTQASLFDLPAAPLPVRRSDPETSRRAARDLRLRARQLDVLVALRHLIVASSADDIAGVLHGMGRDTQRHEVASRLNELRKMDPPLARKVGVKKGRRSAAVTAWALTEDGRRASRGN